MGDLGGYFAVSYLAEHVFTDALEALWRDGWPRASGSVVWSADTPFGELQVDGAISVDKPDIVFRGAADAIDVHLASASRGEVTLAGALVGSLALWIDVAVSLPVTVTQEKAFDRAVVDLGGFTLTAAHVRITWLDGPHQSDGESALLSPAALEALTQEIRTRAASFLSFRLPTDKIWAEETALMLEGIPGSVIITPGIKLGNVRILDGWFALGIDATSSIGETNGNAAAIGPPTDPPPPEPGSLPQSDPGDASLRLLVDPALLTTYLKANARLAVTMAAGTHPSLHPDMNSIDVAVKDDAILLTATGTVDAPDPFPEEMPFQASVSLRPFIPDHSKTPRASVYVSVKPDIWVDAPLILKILGTIADFFGADAFGQLRRANTSEMPYLFLASDHGPVPETSTVMARIEGLAIAIRPDLFAIYGQAKVSTYLNPIPSPAPSTDAGVRIRSRFLQLRLTDERLTTDPTFLVRYAIKRGSNDTPVITGTTWSGNADPFGEEVDLWDPANVLETAFTADMVAERPVGVQVAHTVQSVEVIDAFDRSHPFVRWRKLHYYTGALHPILKLSAVHRTAIPGRCKFCDHREARNRAHYFYEKLDTVPPAEEDGFSTRLCKYCFPDS